LGSYGQKQSLKSAWPPSGYCDFFPNQIILSKFWLQIWWDDAKHRNAPFQQVWGGGSADWQISCLNLKIALKSDVFALLAPPRK